MKNGRVQIRSESNSGIRFYWLYSCLLLVAGFVILFKYDFALGSHDIESKIPGDVSRVFDLSELFAHGFGMVLVGVGIWQLVPEKRYLIPRIIGCAVVPSLAVQGLKLFFGRVRPLAYIQNDATMGFPPSIFDTWIGWMPNGEFNVQYMTQSFASAHTATVCGLAIGMSWAFPKGARLFFFIAILASAQRVVSLAHWGSDVCFGAAIAFMMAGAMTQNWGVGTWWTRLEARLEGSNCEPISLDAQESNRNAA